MTIPSTTHMPSSARNGRGFLNEWRKSGSDVWPWLLAVALAASGIAMFGYGLWDAWARNTDGDMQERLIEYCGFRVGVYPNRSVDTPVEGLDLRYSVYPPYALPMFAIFFEPGGRVQGRIVIEVLSAFALAVMGAWGYSRLRSKGPAWAAVGALAAAGVPAIKSVIAIGQFSTICVGLIVLQIVLLQRGRPLGAGACWAAAMIKPQVGLAFAALFLFNRAWRGLLFGLAILAALALCALWWTEVSPMALVHHWMFEMRMDFAAESSGFGPAAAAEWLGVNHRLTQYVTIAALIVAIGILGRIASSDLWLSDFLPLAAICAVLGRVLLYHRTYDQIMLFPLLLACLWYALACPGWGNLAAAAAVAASLWIPQPVQKLLPGIEIIQPVVWIAAAIQVAAVAKVFPQRGSALPPQSGCG